MKKILLENNNQCFIQRLMNFNLYRFNNIILRLKRSKTNFFQVNPHLKIYNRSRNKLSKRKKVSKHILENETFKYVYSL